MMSQENAAGRPSEALLALLRGQATLAATVQASGLTPREIVRWRRELLRAPLPPRDGRLSAPVSGPVAVRWDTWGVPHIQSDRLADLWVALGFCMAQERLWQLDYMRRFATGQLAAVMGPEALAGDRQLRVLDLAGAARASLATLDEDEQLALDGIAAGINAWIERRHPLPIEFVLLDYEPTPWRPVDSIVLWKYRWWTLTGRLDQVALAEAVERHLPPALRAIYQSAELADETIIPSAAPGLAGPVAGFDPGEGSNNWTVAGSRTSTGRPVLCSDPHNVFGNPPQWFEAQLTAPGIDAIGAIYLGTPGIYLGRNRRVAWGVTNHAVTVRDLYREETHPDDPNRYRDGDTWRPFVVDEQTIEVAGRPAEPWTLRRTIRGPIANELVPAIDDAGYPPLSLRWAGHEPATGLRAMLALQRARSADELRAALEHWPCPPLNFVFADVEGHIGYQVAGSVPQRPTPTRALRTANDPAHDWHGRYALAALPYEHDPARGWIATANNPPWPAQPEHLAYLSLGAWADGYRMRRIRERIEDGAGLTPAAIGAIHGDIVHQRARDLAGPLATLLSTSPAAELRQIAPLLSAWDGRFATDSVAATLFQAIWEQLKRRLVAARLPAAVAGLPIASAQAGEVARRLVLGDDPGWWPAGTTTAGEVTAAALQALDSLRDRLGPDQSTWRWGRLHRVTFPHPLGHRRGLRRLSVGPFATSGGNGTVRAAGFDPGLSFQVTSGSTYRLLCDLSGSRAWATVTTGLSGHPGSPHYRDQVSLWLTDGYKPLWMDDADIEANLAGRQTIVTAGR